MDIEEWRPVRGYETSYEVSSLGRVRSIPRERTSGGVLKPWVNANGYLYVKIGSTAANRRGVTVHTLVAEAFLGPRPKGLETMHLDDDRANPRASNLAYGTPSENNQHKVAAGRDHNASKTHCKSGHEFTPENTMTRRDGTRNCRACNIRRGRERHVRMREN